MLAAVISRWQRTVRSVPVVSFSHQLETPLVLGVSRVSFKMQRRRRHVSRRRRVSKGRLLLRVALQRAIARAQRVPKDNSVTPQTRLRALPA